MIIAVDGPAGAGKSTVAKLIAQKLGFLYIDTGAMYRALTLKVLDSHIDIQDIPAIIRTANNTKINLTNKDDKTLAVFLDGKDVSSEIRQPRITKFVSDIARIKEVREVMLGLQRELGKKSNSILDGRDIGTVVFPDADKKFYLDAKFDERTKRRYKELKGTGQQITSEDVAKDLSNRDKIDSTREHAPLKQAEDAIYIDTTDMTIEEVAETLIKHIGALDVNSH
jgi:cytidylate kinase